MRIRSLGASLLPALLAVAFERSAQGQPCTLVCPPDLDVVATGVRTPVSVLFPHTSGDCSGGEVGGLSFCEGIRFDGYPVGTTIVTCTLPFAEPPLVCQFEIRVSAPTTLDVTFTVAPVVNPNPGTSIYSGASFGPFDVFYSATGQFYVYENGTFSTALPAQGFVASNAAPTDTGVNFIGKNASGQYGTAQVDLCGGSASVRFETFTQQGFNFSQGVFWNGRSTGLICGGTPADGKVFRLQADRNPVFLDPPFELPGGSHLQDVFVDGNACVALGTGKNGFVRIQGTDGEFVDLPWTPGSGTVAPSGNLYVTDAFNPKLYEIKRDGQQVATYDLSAPIFRISTLSNGDVFGLDSPRTFVIFDPDFGLEATYVLPGTGNSIVDFKPARAGETLVFLNDPTVGRSFVEYGFIDEIDLIQNSEGYFAKCLAEIRGRLDED